MAFVVSSEQPHCSLDLSHHDDTASGKWNINMPLHMDYSVQASLSFGCLKAFTHGGHASRSPHVKIFWEGGVNLGVLFRIGAVLLKGFIIDSAWEQFPGCCIAVSCTVQSSSTKKPGLAGLWPWVPTCSPVMIIGTL